MSDDVHALVARLDVLSAMAAQDHYAGRKVPHEKRKAEVQAINNRIHALLSPPMPAMEADDEEDKA